MFCSNCGAQIPDDSIFCEKCGYRVKGEISGQQYPSGPDPFPNEGKSVGTQAPFPNEGKSGGSRMALYMVTGVVILAVVGAGLFFFRKGRPDSGGGSTDSAEILADTGTGTDQPAASESQKPDETEMPETDPLQDSEETADTAHAPEEMEEHAGDVSGEVSGEVSEEVSGEVSGEVSMADFEWFLDGALPANRTRLWELQDLGGHWKSLLRVQAASDEADIYRLLLSDAEIQYMGYKAAVLFQVKGRYECPVDDRNSLTELETEDGIVMTFNGDWNEERGIIEAESINSTLALQIHDYAEAEGVQYALGTVMNGDAAIGEAAFVRSVNH